ncbi:DUF6044 family protein [Mesobacillus zeae]|uniref:YkoS n=1 Tax=Mesobacillus zeae TaxID=1917180 RepID=A0A398BKQ5_9BACI|nr:DUF6044 family protein [Mesobacillus zeae]RID88340.1 hypothetical protein D1970_02270 [Mesobacillus zeae]
MASLEKKKDSRMIAGALIVLALYLSPLVILGEDAHIRVHDNLDSNLAWYKVLANSGEMMGDVDARIPQIINGQLQRNAFGTEYTLIVWLYALLPTMAAYTLSQAITRFAAFLGMYLLLKKHLLPDSRMSSITVLSALAFALTPFWPSGMLSTLGMPLALWAFLNIRNGERGWVNYLVLTLLPFYSSIVLGFFFFITMMGIFWLTDVLRGRGWNWRFLLSIAYMTFVYLLLDYRLVYSFLFDQEPNSRDEYFHARLSFFDSVRLTFKNYLLGHTHVLTLHTLVILPVIFTALFMIWKRNSWREEKVFTFLFVLNFLLSLWYAFWFYKGWLPLTERFHFLDTFNFARYHFVRPLILYLLFALGLKVLWHAGGGGKKAVSWLGAAQVIVLLLGNDEIVYRNKPSVKEFYAVEQFSDVKDYIGLSQEEYRVASLGLHPAISQYNGFYTLDTYNNFYPLTYKRQFRKIIEKELEKSRRLRIYFDEWGGRCYLYSAELGKHYSFKKTSRKKIEKLELNTEQFKQMGGRYILSALPIQNAADNRLELEKVFHSDTSAWKIHLYRAI